MLLVRLCVIGLAVLLAIPASPADAGTLSFGEEEGDVGTTFSARAGERNDLRITRRPGGAIRYQDRGAALALDDDQSGDNCDRRDARTLDCSGYRLFVELGDHDDRLTVRGSVDLALAEGGAGDDVLRGGSNGELLTGDGGSDMLEGGSGADSLIGGAGRDVVNGGSGDDVLSGDIDDADGDADVVGTGPRSFAPVFSDLLEGGRGTDIASYTARPRGVLIDLSRGWAGRGTERDRLRSIEGAHGGWGNDVLLGTDRANVLVGGQGADRIDARGGNDSISLVGDQPSRDRSRDRVRCGSGRDRVGRVGDHDRLATDCESRSPS